MGSLLQEEEQYGEQRLREKQRGWKQDYHISKQFNHYLTHLYQKENPNGGVKTEGEGMLS